MREAGSNRWEAGGPARGSRPDLGAGIRPSVNTPLLALQVIRGGRDRHGWRASLSLLATGQLLTAPRDLQRPPLQRQGALKPSLRGSFRPGSEERKMAQASGKGRAGWTGRF